MPTVRTIGISGPSCSGKTTVTRILQRLLRNSLVIYQDDFFKPDDKIPIDPNTQLANWDCPDALDFPKLKATIAFVRTNGILPPEFQSNEINNTHDGSGLLSDEAFQRLCTMVSTWDQKDSIFLIVDGFMLYWDESIYQDLECRVFITASYDVLKSRREARQGYTTKEGYWQDPPGYFDAIVWPEYVKWNKHLLDKDENIHNAVENVLVLDTTKESIEKSATRTVQKLLETFRS